jgi:hypothetical protein
VIGAVVGFGVLGLSLAYWYPVRRWYRHWGATDAEVGRPMPGDPEAGAAYETTLAITIDAPPNAIWPWLLQMGYRRGGLYSYDWLDRAFGYLDAPSAERILPEFQQLQVGDVVPVGRGGGFPVRIVDPCRALVLGGESDGMLWLWQFGLYPIDSRHTRLVSRTQAKLPRTVGWAVFMCLLEPAAFIMTRRMLLGLRRRAEAVTTTGKRAAANAA